MTASGLSLKGLDGLTSSKKTAKFPVVFLGHGSPMNAIADNNFTKTLNLLGKDLPKPNAILCISAHWMTEGSWLTSMEAPKTIHDFYGFPQALFDVQYPAKGDPELAKLITKEITSPSLHLDSEAWGLDHGTWSVLKHMYPEANIPVIQLSLNMARTPEYHYNLGKELARLREQGVLIVGSGNIVHNLRTIKWDEKAPAYPWAIEFDEWAKKKIETREYKSLYDDALKSEAGRLSVPTLDHYLPMLYILGASDSKDELKFEYEEMQNASISMRCFSFGRV